MTAPTTPPPNPPGTKPNNSNKLFGGRMDPKGPVPKVVLDMIAIIEKYGMNAEGIFRISGQVSQVLTVKQAYENKQHIELDEIVRTSSIHTLAGVLKSFLREMEEPLLSFELYEGFVAGEGIADKSERLTYITNLVHTLPPCHFATLKHLMELLYKICKNSQVNKMHSSNLAIVIAPNILRSDEQSMESIIQDTPIVTAVVESLISNYPTVFKDSTGTPAATEKIVEKTAPVIERRSTVGEGAPVSTPPPAAMGVRKGTTAERPIPPRPNMPEKNEMKSSSMKDFGGVRVMPDLSEISRKQLKDSRERTLTLPAKMPEEAPFKKVLKPVEEPNKRDEETRKQRERIEREIRRDIEKHERDILVRRISKKIAPLTPEVEAQIAADIAREGATSVLPEPVVNIDMLRSLQNQFPTLPRPTSEHRRNTENGFVEPPFIQPLPQVTQEEVKEEIVQEEVEEEVEEDEEGEDKAKSETNEQVLQLKDMAEGLIDDISDELDLLKKDLIKSVSVYNVNGVLVIGRVVQTIKKQLNGNPDAQCNITEEEFRQVYNYEPQVPTPAVQEKTEKLQIMILEAFEEISKKIAKLADDTPDTVTQEEAQSMMVSTVRLIRNIQQLLSKFGPSRSEIDEKWKDSFVLFEDESSRLVSKVQLYLETVQEDVKMMVSMEQALLVTQVLRSIKQVLRTPRNQIKDEVVLFQRPPSCTINQEKLESLRKVIGLVLVEVSTEVKQLKHELDSFKSPQVHVEISKVLKIIVKFLEQIHDEIQRGYSQQDESSETESDIQVPDVPPPDPEQGASKLRSMLLSGITTTSNNLVALKDLIDHTKSIDQAVRYSTIVRNMRLFMDSPVEDMSDLIPPQVTVQQPRTPENMKKAEALRRLCSPIFVDLQRGLVEIRENILEASLDDVPQFTLVVTGLKKLVEAAVE